MGSDNGTGGGVGSMTREVETIGWPLPSELVEEWRRLEAESPMPSIFRTPEWVQARVAALGLTDQAEVHVWRDGERLAAVLATVSTRERIHHRVPFGLPVTSLAASGVGGADHAGWTGGPSSHALVRRWLDEQSGTVLFRNLDPELVAAAGLGGRTIERSRCPRLDLTTWPGPSKSFAKKIAYFRRRAEREGFAVTVVEPGEVDRTHLGELRRLHGERFGGSSSLSEASFAIQERLLERASAEVGPVVVRLQRDGETVAIVWCLWFAGVFAFYQTGWDDAHRELSPGVILVDEAIQVARRLGATTFDFLRGPEDYKYRFGAEDRVDETVLIPHGLSGAALAAKAKLRERAAGAEHASEAGEAS
jgi:CelD/BcsL family acetyltransferase involved in cellulose biosynthesis